jgi:outer membrane protein OmpA-like peptidoglycan-associated protein
VKSAAQSCILEPMRVSSVLAFVVVACAAVPVRAAELSADETNVNVNMGALPIPMPRPKPTDAEMRPLAQARPRPKPALDAILQSASAVAMSPIPDAPMPRWKPTIDGTAVEAAVASPLETPAATKAAAVPPAQPALPVALVKPTTDETFPVEITGVPEDPNAALTPVDPTAGFAVLSRVRFPRGASDIPAQAHAALDDLAARLLASNYRVRLAGFSGKAGGDTSEARRLSLARALAIRTYLVGKGVPVERVDVLAFGGATKGTTDRVDVLVRGI